MTLITIFCGLFSRSQCIALPNFVETYAGDTLWALIGVTREDVLVLAIDDTLTLRVSKKAPDSNDPIIIGRVRLRLQHHF